MQQLLMIDDDARLAAMVRDYLGASGYTVEVAGDLAHVGSPGVTADPTAHAVTAPTSSRFRL